MRKVRLVPIHPSRNGQLNPLTPGLLARRTIVTKDLVHFFKRLASCLRHEEVHPAKRKQAENSEEHVCAEAGIFDQRRGNEADDEVEEPIAGR
jgi:hypothetical protein